MSWHVEMHEVYSSVCSFRGEGEDQGRIWIRIVKSGRAPGLDHEPLRDDLERRTGERAIEGLERGTRLEVDRDRRTSDRRMLRGIGVHHEETFGRGRQDDRLGNDGSHGTLASSSESGDTGQCTPPRPAAARCPLGDYIAPIRPVSSRFVRAEPESRQVYTAAMNLFLAELGKAVALASFSLQPVCRRVHGLQTCMGLFLSSGCFGLLPVLCSERERPFFVPSPAIRSPERAEGVKGPKR